MSGNRDDFTTEQVRALIKRQGFVTAAMAKVIARHTGRSERSVIAASAAIGNYDPNFPEMVDQARMRFVARSGDQGGLISDFSGTSKKIVYLALVLLLAGLLARCVMGSGSDGDSPPQVSSAYAKCEAELKPKLNRCLQGPESTWEACGEAYMSELKTCTNE